MLRYKLLILISLIPIYGSAQDKALQEKLEVSSLEEAYQKELVYLRREKRLLEERLAQQQRSQDELIKNLSADIATLQNKNFQLKQIAGHLEKKSNKLQGELLDFDEQKQNLESTLLQSNSTLKSYSIPVAEESLGFTERLSHNYNKGIEGLKTLDDIRQEEGEFFLQDGRKVSGTITRLGQIAAFGHSPLGGGGLAPAGDGHLQVWLSENGKIIPTMENQEQGSLQLYLFDSLEKDHSLADPKTIKDTLVAGGSIGWVIASLGIFVALAIAARAIILKRFQINHKATEAQLSKSQDLDELSKTLPGLKGGSARLVELALSNLQSSKFEDIVAEGYIEQSHKLDYFNTFILVVSAVAPLLGLLGTVTGMIGTFDIITEVGTGDPKLLSSGISEALITTMFGLIVAIPALLLGNLLSSWAEKLKNDMEKLILNISNRFDHAAS